MQMACTILTQWKTRIIHHKKKPNSIQSALFCQNATAPILHTWLALAFSTAVPKQVRTQANRYSYTSLTTAYIAQVVKMYFEYVMIKAGLV